MAVFTRRYVVVCSIIAICVLQACGNNSRHSSTPNVHGMSDEEMAAYAAYQRAYEEKDEDALNLLFEVDEEESAIRFVKAEVQDAALVVEVEYFNTGDESYFLPERDGRFVDGVVYILPDVLTPKYLTEVPPRSSRTVTVRIPWHGGDNEAVHPDGIVQEVIYTNIHISNWSGSRVTETSDTTLEWVRDRVQE